MKAKHILSSLLIIGLLAGMWTIPVAADDPQSSAGVAVRETRGYAPPGPDAPIVNALECPAGYSKTILFAEDFETWPLPDWNIVNNGGDCVWDSNTNWGRTNYAGGDGLCADADSDACGSGTTMDTELWSPAVDLSGGGMLLFGYVASYNFLSGAEYAATDISTDGGGTWTNLVTWQEDHDAYGPGEEVALDITAFGGSADTHVRFHYYAPAWDWWFEVDQVEIALCEPLEGLYVEPEYQAGGIVPGTSADFDLTVLNFTGMEENIDIGYQAGGPGTCYGPTYQAGIPDGESWPFVVTVEMDAAAQPGEVVTCEVIVDGEYSGLTDQAIIEAQPFFPGEAYALDVYPGLQLVEWPDLQTPGTWNLLGSVPQFHPAGDFLGDDYTKLYALDYDSNEFVSISTINGTRTVIGTAVPTGNWTGMTGAADGSTLYAASSACGTESYLYEIDPATGTATLIGSMRPGSCMIDIAINAAGEMYGVDIVDDSLYTIDTTTGVATLVGSTGASANYAQGMDFDFATDTLYWAAYTSQGELRTLDTGTGMSTLIGTFPGGNEVDAFAIVGGGGQEMTMHVEDMFLMPDYPFLHMRVQVADQAGMPLGDVVVDAAVTMPFAEWGRWRMTRPSGWARFWSLLLVPGYYEICVGNLELEGYTYNPGDNVYDCMGWDYMP